MVKFKKNTKGITLIALVVTIIVLLLLAGISISMLTSQNSVISRAGQAKIENAHKTVQECMALEVQEYKIKKSTGETTETLIEFLKNKGIISETTGKKNTKINKKIASTDFDIVKSIRLAEIMVRGESYLINIEKLTGTKLALGNGTDYEDVYILEDYQGANNPEIKKYRIMYYGKDETEDRDLGDIEEESLEDNQEEPSDLSIFEFDPSTGGIALKNAQTYYTDHYTGDGKVTTLEKIVVPSEIDGVKVTKIGIGKISTENNSPYTIGLNTPYVKEIVLPDTINTLDKKVFCGCSNLEKINIPNEVTSIGWGAFLECESLANIKIPKKTNSIENEAFGYCTSLEYIEVETGNASYIDEDGILYNKDKTTLITYPMGKKDEIYNIPNSVDSFGYGALSYNQYLKTVNIPKDFTYYVTDFVEWKNLANINVDSENAHYSSENGILYDKNKTTLMMYPCGKTEDNFSIPETVTAVNYNAIKYNKNLKSVIIPQGVSRVLCDFSYCDSLTNIEVDSRNEYYSSVNGVLFNNDKTELIAYPGGKTDDTYTVPDGVKQIKYMRGNKNLNQIIIPNSVTTLEQMVFMNCSPELKITVKSGSKLTSTDFKGSGIDISQVTFE